jgi:hypothetical protein
MIIPKVTKPRRYEANKALEGGLALRRTRCGFFAGGVRKPSRFEGITGSFANRKIKKEQRTTIVADQSWKGIGACDADTIAGSKRRLYAAPPPRAPHYRGTSGHVSTPVSA